MRAKQAIILSSIFSAERQRISIALFIIPVPLNKPHCLSILRRTFAGKESRDGKEKFLTTDEFSYLFRPCLSSCTEKCIKYKCNI